MKKTIAQQLNIIEFPFEIKDKNGNILYDEDSDGNWERYERDKNGNILYSKDSDGDWYRYERDKNGNILYSKDSDGLIIDNRVTTITKEEAEKKFNIKIK